MASLSIFVEYEQKDFTVHHYEVNVLPSATVASIRDVLELPTVEFYYCGYQLRLKDTMERVEILQAELPRYRPSRKLAMAQYAPANLWRRYWRRQ